MRHWMLGLLLFGFVVARDARADVPGPRPTCETEGLTCETCWKNYGGDQAAFEECAAPLRAKGLTEGCHHRQGAGDQVFFCANGAKPPVVTRTSGGCGGCAVAPDGDGATLALVVTGLVVVGAARRRQAR